MGKTPNWKDELWTFLANHDVDRCPVSDSCELRKGKGLCVIENMKVFTAMVINDGGVDSKINEFHKCDKLVAKAAGRIMELVEKLADEFLQDAGIRHPPVSDELALVADPGREVEIRLLPLRNHRGATWSVDGNWIIQLNQREPHMTRRITLFHEVFHILSHRNESPVFREAGGEGFFTEAMSDSFAVRVLMPKAWVTAKWAEVKDLKQMAEIFGVSTAAMRRRLLFLNLTE